MIIQVENAKEKEIISCIPKRNWKRYSRAGCYGCIKRISYAGSLI